MEPSWSSLFVSRQWWARRERSGRRFAQPLDRVGFGRRLVGADPRDAGKAHGEAGFVALAGVDRIEGDLEHQALLDLAHRAEALDGVGAHPTVEPFQLLVGEAEIGLADRQQLAARCPAAEGVIRIIRRAL